MIDFNGVIEDAFLAGDLGSSHTNLHLYPEIETQGLAGWFQPGNVGDTGGASSKPHGTSMWSAGQPTTVTVRPVGQYDNFYFVKDLPLSLVAPPTRFVSTRLHSIIDTKGWQALEFEHELHWGGYVYNKAWQIGLIDKLVRYFNYTISEWIPTNIPLPSVAALLTVAEFEIDTVAHTTTHVALTINGIRYPVNITQPATPKLNIGTKLTIAEQMDATANPVPLTMMLSTCDLIVV